MYDGKAQWKEEIQHIRNAEIVFSKHFLRRITARRIKQADIDIVIRKGEIIQGHAPLMYKRNSDPIRVIMGPGRDGSPLHLVVALQKKAIKLMTVYSPDTKIWEDDFKTLKPRGKR